jgi:WhiB family redox-sensing transcriptional regulator
MTQQGLVTHGNSIKNMDGIKAPYFDGSQPCAQTDPELFFPDNAGEAFKRKSIVKLICGSCEFQTDCLEYALNNDVLGIWGGVLESERRRLRRYRRVA